MQKKSYFPNPYLPRKITVPSSSKSIDWCKALEIFEGIWLQYESLCGCNSTILKKVRKYCPELSDRFSHKNFPNRSTPRFPRKNILKFKGRIFLILLKNSMPANATKDFNKENYFKDFIKLVELALTQWSQNNNKNFAFVEILKGPTFIHLLLSQPMAMKKLLKCSSLSLSLPLLISAAAAQHTPGLQGLGPAGSPAPNVHVLQRSGRQPPLRCPAQRLGRHPGGLQHRQPVPRQPGLRPRPSPASGANIFRPSMHRQGRAFLFWRQL
jgi:hypothetical protein